MSFDNRAILIGRVGRDPEIRTVGSSGDMVATFSLATSERWKDKNSGERKELTEWHRIVIWNENIIKIVEQYVHKGDLIGIEGTIRTRKFTDKDGVERASTEIVLDRYSGQLRMFGSPDGGNAAGAGGQRPEQPAQRAGRADPRTQDSGRGANWGADLDDEIPF